MPKIETLLLRSCNPQTQRRFYCEILGMTELDDGSVGYGGEEAKIRFLKAKDQYKPRPNDLYWKIALAVPNIDLAYQQLISQGIQVDTPRQFQDIGFLAHFLDPEGFTIELIEHWFEGNRQDVQINPKLLGGGAHLNLITLRTVNIEMIREVCASWNMTLLSIQSVENHGFTLYFFAFTSDVPPSSNLHSIKNREWLYQRKYTVLEVQHIHDSAVMIQSPSKEMGYAGIEFSNGFHDINRASEKIIKTPNFINQE